MANQLIFKTDNMASVTTAPGIAYTSEASGLILGLLRRVCRYQKCNQDRHKNGQKKKGKRTNKTYIKLKI
jgi:hypothetical protein